jgi:hypothetical protein
LLWDISWVLFTDEMYSLVKLNLRFYCVINYIQIYHAWEGYLRKIKGERRKFSLKTGIFHKYPSQTWYICLITPNII